MSIDCDRACLRNYINSVTCRMMVLSKMEKKPKIITTDLIFLTEVVFSECHFYKFSG